MIKRLLILLALAVIVALPFVFRPPRAAVAAADDTLVIITPHNEAIRYEFGRAFARWHQERTGRSVGIDWRVIGGTSEIARFLEGEYTTAFQNHWTRGLGRPWSAEIQAGFQNGRLPAGATETVKEARAAFLASDVSCGIDLFFGGGTYDFERQALAGRLVDSGITRIRPEWFSDSVIPRRFGGEDFRHPEALWVGTVLSTYGILYNREALKRLGIEREPLHWSDLGDPRLQGEVALADPTKSGSVAKAFENVIQQQMQQRLRELEARTPRMNPGLREQQAVIDGWRDGLRVIQAMGANARYFTDSSQKPPIDVAAGNCAVGLCIDFYGRQQEEAVRRRSGSHRLGYISPPGGSVASVDPIGLLRGAPNREVAVSFIEFTLSMEGQKLWNFKPGTPGGPERFALRRVPVRRDYFEHEEWRQYRSDPNESPFTDAEPLIYREEWTGRIFREMAFIIRVMCQDAHQELKRAWQAVNAAPEPARSEALAVLHDLSAVEYPRVAATIRPRLGARDRVEEVRLARELAQQFRSNYERAEAIANSARAESDR